MTNGARPASRASQQPEPQIYVRDPAAGLARGLRFTSRPLRKEGAGKAGCALHPRSRAQNCAKKRTRAYRFSGSSPAFPAQWFYGLLRDLPGDQDFLSPSLAASRPCAPGRANKATTNLTPTMRRQDHTTSPSAAALAKAIDGRGTHPPKFCAKAGSASVVRAPSRRSRAKPALRYQARPTLPRPPHPTPRQQTIAIRPSCGVRRRESCR
jgi:hypothetical protein